MSIDTIYASLNELAYAVDYLEQELERKEAALAAKEAELVQKAKELAAQPVPAPARKLPGMPGQNDLFSDWATPSGRPANANKAAQLAKKLDNAIENVQWLLKSAEA